MKTIRNIFFSVTVCMAAVCLFSSFELIKKVQGTGDLAKESYDIADFNEIKLSCPGDVYYEQGSGKPTLKVVTDENILDSLEIIVKKGVLIIRPGKLNVNLYPTKLDIHVKSTGLEEVDVVGSGEVHITSALNTTDLEADVQGGGSIHFLKDVKAVEIEASVKGDGGIDFKGGSTGTAEFSVSGNGNIEAEGVEAQKAKTAVLGNGYIRVNSAQKLSATITGNGNVYYKGNPKIESNVVGSGRLIEIK